MIFMIDDDDGGWWIMMIMNHDDGGGGRWWWWWMMMIDYDGWCTHWVTHWNLFIWVSDSVLNRLLFHFTLCHNDGSDFIKTNQQFHLKTFIKLHNIVTHDWKTSGVPPPKPNHFFTWHWVTNIFDFINTNYQNYIKTLRKLHNIFIKLYTLFGVLSFNITLVFRLFAKGKTFVYMSPCLQKFDNSCTSSIYFSDIDKNYYVMPGGKRIV